MPRPRSVLLRFLPNSTSNQTSRSGSQLRPLQIPTLLSSRLLPARSVVRTSPGTTDCDSNCVLAAVPPLPARKAHPDAHRLREPLLVPVLITPGNSDHPTDHCATPEC